MKLPDLSKIPENEKAKHLIYFMQESGKYLIAYMKMFGLKSHVESTVIHGDERFNFSFRTEEYNTKQIELIKAKAIQDYLLEHGANDEKVNDKVRELEGLIVSNV